MSAPRSDRRIVALSFDLEEFDLPMEHGADIPLDRQMDISRHGTERILHILGRHNVKATFFSTVNFARHAPELITRIIAGGHELASHGICHTGFAATDPAASRQQLQQLSGKPVAGFRMPRMMRLPEQTIADAGYSYDSSLNPTFIPGRYMNLGTPRRPFMKDGVLQIPTSVTPWVRFPLFWLSCHLLPQRLYRGLVRHTLRHDGYFTTYFHPWEFHDLNTLPPAYRIPPVVRRNSGAGMEERLDKLIAELKHAGNEFATYSRLYDRFIGTIRK